MWRQWYPNGQRLSEGERRYDPQMGGEEREGPWTFWYSNGRVRATGSFRAGRRHGPWVFYDDAGTIDEFHTGDYVDGVKAE